MLQGMTAHYLGKTIFPLHAGHIALIHAAAGGVVDRQDRDELLAVQIVVREAHCVLDFAIGLHNAAGTIENQDKGVDRLEHGREEIALSRGSFVWQSLAA